MFDDLPVSCCVKDVIIVFVGAVVLDVRIQVLDVAISTCKRTFNR